MYIGFSQVDITPRLGLELCGYGYYLGRKAKAILDPLYVRAVVLKDDRKTLLLVNCDLIGLTSVMVQAIKAAWEEEYGLDGKNAMLLSTHTHSGPATGLLRGCGEVDAEYVHYLSDRIIHAGGEALRTTVKVTRVSGFSDVVENMAWNRVFGKDGPIDKKVYGLIFEREGLKPVVLVNYACHPVTLGRNHAISADYPGRVVSTLNQAGYEAVFLNGFCGDVDPELNRDDWGGGTEATINEYGRRIAEVSIRAIQNARPLLDMTLDSAEVSARLPLQSLTQDMVQEAKTEVEAMRSTDPNHARAIEEWLDEMQIAEALEAEIATVQILRLGEVLLVGFPGEPFTQLGLNIKRALPKWQILTLGTANGPMRYIPVMADQKNRGYASYESCRVYNRLPLQSGAGEYLAEATIAAIEGAFGHS